MVPAWGAVTCGSAPILAFLFPTRHRGAPQPHVRPEILYRDGLVCMTLETLGITSHFLTANSIFGRLIGKDLPAVTGRLPAAIGVLWM